MSTAGLETLFSPLAVLHARGLLPDLNPSGWWHFKYPQPSPEFLVTAAEGSVCDLVGPVCYLQG